MKKLKFTVEINASCSKVYNAMIHEETYKVWTSAFCEGSYYEGSWNKNEKIQFLSPEGGGMYSEIAENRSNEFISIRHLGIINNGIPDTESVEVKSWTPAYENYTFVKKESETYLIVEMDSLEEYEKYLNETWPKALLILKDLCEK